MSSRDEHDTKQRKLLAEEPARDDRESSASGSGPAESTQTGAGGSLGLPQSGPDTGDDASGSTGAMGRPAWLREQSNAPKWMPQAPTERPDRELPRADAPSRSNGATKLPPVTPEAVPAETKGTAEGQGDAAPADLFPGLKRFLEGMGAPPSAVSEPTRSPDRQPPAPGAPTPRFEAPQARRTERRDAAPPPLPVPETMPTRGMPVPETRPTAGLPVPETMPTGKKPPAEGKSSGLFSSAKDLFAPKEARSNPFGTRPDAESDSDGDGGAGGAAGRTLFGNAEAPVRKAPPQPQPRTQEPRTQESRTREPRTREPRHQDAPAFGSRRPFAEPPRPPEFPERSAGKPQSWGDGNAGLGNRPAPFAPGATSPGGPSAHLGEPERRPTSESLTADVVLRKRGNRPGRGWRRSLYKFTLGYVNLGPSQAELQERQQNQRLRTPLVGSHRLAVISLKGGVGKTTTTAGLGATFASVRGDRVIAIDANPDRGTLGEKVPRQTPRTVRDLLQARADIHRYSDVRAYTSQANSRLEVLASDTDPAMSLAFSEEDYRQAVDILSNFYSLILTDCGTGLLHDAMRGVLAMADSLVVVSSASLDGARSASATLDWLEAHGYEELVRRSVAVISAVHGGGTPVDIDKLEEHFAARCRAVVRIPWDPHLEEGSVVELEELRPATRNAYRELAALVADDFPSSRQWRPSSDWGKPPRG